MQNAWIFQKEGTEWKMDSLGHLLETKQILWGNCFRNLRLWYA
uniref:Uncharacterized protein n=1 Tax=Rhizophora mucronata TaxID=61149 RepID=A0A2P2QBJ9_RHIMU